MGYDVSDRKGRGIERAGNRELVERYWILFDGRRVGWGTPAYLIEQLRARLTWKATRTRQIPPIDTGEATHTAEHSKLVGNRLAETAAAVRSTAGRIS